MIIPAKLIRTCVDEALRANRAKSISDFVERSPGSHIWIAIPWNGKVHLICGACSFYRRGGDIGPCPGLAPAMPALERDEARRARR